ncbi:hypothetical protein Glove_79g30 [Diversispora epigaea]|uniref:Protein kinase domain-containing protein n=1 Tax=Diversispora epigaea TaxID=1348612 RepID=A0A397J992_9GLOM|nr:hypothetical protein Glove_79g30 [Diversispora epigaea]
MKIKKYAQNAMKNMMNIGANLKHLQNDFNKWTNVKQICKDGFVTIHYARWIDDDDDDEDEDEEGDDEDEEDDEDKEDEDEDEDEENEDKEDDDDDEVGAEVALKKFDNFVNFDDVLYENIFGILPYIVPEVLSDDEEYTKAADVYSFGIIAYEIVTGFPPYPDIPHDKDLAMKICNGLRLKIPFHILKLVARMIMRCWDARVAHRPTFKELFDELAFYTSRLNFSKLPKPKNEENFEKEESTKSTSVLSIADSGMMDLNV